MTAWTEAEQKRIAEIQEQRSCTRANAIRRLQAEKKAPSEAKVKAQLKADLDRATAPKLAVVKKAKAPKMPGKTERLAIAAKEGTSELEVYLELCKKFGRTPAASAVKRHKALKDGK